MTKKLLLLSLLTVAGVTFSACGKQNDQAKDEPQQVPAAQEEKNQKDESAEGFSGSIQELIANNKAQKCTWEQEGKSRGIVYTDGKKSFVESEVTVDGKKQTGNVLTDSDMVYIWETAGVQGIKMNIKDTAVQNMADKYQQEMSNKDVERPDENSLQNNVLSQEIDLKCENWTVDPNKFVVPSNVEFQDISKTIEQIAPSSNQLKAVCDTLSGEEKTECLQGLEKFKQ